MGAIDANIVLRERIAQDDVGVAIRTGPSRPHRMTTMRPCSHGW